MSSRLQSYKLSVFLLLSTPWKVPRGLRGSLRWRAQAELKLGWLHVSFPAQPGTPALSYQTPWVGRKQRSRSPATTLQKITRNCTYDFCSCVIVEKFVTWPHPASRELGKMWILAEWPCIQGEEQNKCWGQTTAYHITLYNLLKKFF